MRRNTMVRAVAPDMVLAVMAAAVDALCTRLPGEPRASIERVVYEVAAELVSTVTEPERLATMLRRRATARLAAATGELIPVQSTSRLPAPR